MTLNRPDKLNAISPELKKRARSSASTRPTAIRPPAWWCCGPRAELLGRATTSRPTRPGPRGKGNALAWHESLTDDVALEMTPWDMRKPVIASVQGHCLGGAASW